MMFLLNLVLSAATVQAMPAVGDSATYNFVSNGRKGTLTQSVTAFDESANTFNVQTVVASGGQKSTRNDSVAANDLLSDEQVADVLANCADYGGTPTQATVPAGTFNTCKIISKGSDGTVQTVYFAKDIAFGFVYLTQKKIGDSLEASLVSSQRGQ